VTGAAHAKLNLALLVGPRREDGMHDIVTVYQRLALADTLSIEPAESTTVEGFPEDTLVTSALAALDAPHGWRVVIDKQIPVAAGLGGGSSDAATALRLANDTLERPLGDPALRRIAAGIGADVPFFFEAGPQLGTGTGTTLEPIELPQSYGVCLLLPHGAGKPSTRVVYESFDRRSGGEGFDERASALHAALAQVRAPRDLAALPPNDLGGSPHAAALLAAGAFRADVSGAGAAVYGLFDDRAAADRGREAVAALGRCWVTDPAW
jgi:4-diphosphocytidyl-2-C-methyl-D-erythritol kinase